jgi:serine/threonine protein phosphatase PrpC
MLSVSLDDSFLFFIDLHKDGDSTGGGASRCSVNFINNACLQCPWILAVFDGHGRGGYVAAKVASQVILKAN